MSGTWRNGRRKQLRKVRRARRAERSVRRAEEMTSLALERAAEREQERRKS